VTHTWPNIFTKPYTNVTDINLTVLFCVVSS